MKIFIWENVLSDHTPGIAFALAKNEKEARELILAKFTRKEGFTSDSFVLELNSDPLVIEAKDGFYLFGGG